MHLTIFLNDVFADGQAALRLVSGRGTTADRSEVLEASGMPGAPANIDDQLFHVLYARTAGSLRAYASRVLGRAAYADDIVQESYLRLVRSPPATSDLQQLRAFLFRIASRLIVDHWRRGRFERGAGGAPADTRGEPAPDFPLRLDMARVFESLSPQQRQLMWLAYVEGSDHREIAEALGLSHRSVRVLLYRTRRKLARLLREGGHGALK